MEAIKAFVSSFATGLIDSVKGISLFIELMKQNNDIKKTFLNSVFLNIFVLAFSVLTLEYILYPIFYYLLYSLYSILFPGDTTRDMIGTVITVVSYVVNGLWILPLLWISKIINILTFQKMAWAAYRATYPPKDRNSRSPNHDLSKSVTTHISRILADCIFGMVIELIFMLQSIVISFIPIIGSPAYLLHLSILNALYAFEYKWMHQGIETKTRLRIIHCGWPYFIGYASILTLATFIPSSFVLSACIYSAFFPLYIVSAYPAKINFSHHAIPQLRIFTLSSLATDRLFVKSARTRSPGVERRQNLRDVTHSIPPSVTSTDSL